MNVSRWGVLVVVLAAVGCGDDGGSSSSNGGSGGQGDAGSSGVGGTGGSAGAGAAAGLGGSSGSGSGGSAGAGGSSPGTLDEYGFMRRLPQTRQITCSGTPEGGEPSTQSLQDSDFLCTFAYGGQTATLYFQNTVVACTFMMSAQPTFESRGWVAQGGTVSSLSGVAYDWGGNHHNDSIDFTLAGTDFRYYHSSFGFGWRSCQPVDCIQVLNASDAVTRDGCEPTRSLPITCVAVEADGTAAALEDTFALCPGDSG